MSQASHIASHMRNNDTSMAPSITEAHLIYEALIASWALRRAAYEQETRTTILGLDRVSKVAPNGKEILKDVRFAMYKGAKIGMLDHP